MENNIDAKLNICLTRLNYLKSISDCPKFYLINQFKNCITDVDLNCESVLMKQSLDATEREIINTKRENIIKRVNEFETKCINRYNCKQDTETNEFARTIEIIENKIKYLSKNNCKASLENQCNDISYLIDYEIYKLKRRIFNDENIIFLNRDLCEKYIFNFNNYDDVYDTEPGSKDTTDYKILFGILVSLKNGYISKNKLIQHRKKTLCDMQLTDEIIKLCYAAKKIKEKKCNLNDAIIEIDLNELYTLKELDVSNQYFSTIRTECFEKCPKLEKLILKSTSLEKFESNSFFGLENLKELKINKYGELRRHYFDPLLKRFSSVRVELKESGCLFQDLVSLESLDLTNNRIKMFNDRFLFGLLSLRRLDLSNNHLEALKSMCFSCLINLEELKLEANELRNLDSNCFFGLKNLKLLSLERNKIDNINLKVFDTLNELTYLNLGCNTLSNLEEFVFSSLYKLERLDLCDNYIDELYLNNFDGLTSLKVLILDRNDLRSDKITNSFDQLINLTELSLENNFITNIDNLLCKLTNLEILRLSFNQVNELNESCFINNSKLKIIDLVCNTITKIKEGSFEMLEHLESIDLRHNQLEGIPSNMFSKSAKTIKEINLTNNSFDNAFHLSGIDPKLVIFESEE